MKINWKKLLLCLALPLAVGGLAALLSGGMDIYKELDRPPLSPPGWVFPIVWSILYLLQLAANFLWPLLFFGGQMYLAALVLLTLLWLLIFLAIRGFSAVDERAGDLLIPYLLWVSFAWYLNLGVFLLN